jgi:hypothetical protein
MSSRLLNNIGLWAVFAVVLLSTACPSGTQSPVVQAKQQEAMAPKDINAVLKDHQAELMGLPGVVGIYVGLLPDEKTLCLKVMAVEVTENLRKRIPKSLEGHPVLIEESGVIRPLTDKQP